MDAPIEKWIPAKEKQLVAPEKMEARELAVEVKSRLLSLQQKDEDLENFGISVEKTLAETKAMLDSLKKRFPDNPDLLALESIHSDLQSDLDRHEETEIDTAYESILKDVDNVMKLKGVRREAPDEKSILSGTVAKLKGLGISPEYVVTSGNPKAKTVVLFMQVHSNPGVTKQSADSMGITGSQSQIESAIDQAFQSGFVRDIYEEGLSSGGNVSSDQLDGAFSDRPDYEFSASWRAKRKYGDEIGLKGYESLRLQPSYALEAIQLGTAVLKGELTLKDLTQEQKQLLGKLGEFGKYRGTAINTLIASNMSENLEKSNQQVVFMNLGGMHEKLPSQFGKDNPLPISNALAYYGLNVVVVDAMSSHFKLPTMVASAK